MSRYTRDFNRILKAIAALESGGMTLQDWDRIANDGDARDAVLAALGRPVDECSLSAASFDMQMRQLILDDAFALTADTDDPPSDSEVDSFLDDESFQAVLNGLRPHQRWILKAYYLYEGGRSRPTILLLARSTEMSTGLVRQHLDSAKRAVAMLVRTEMARRRELRWETDGEGNEYALSSPVGALERLQHIVDNPTVPPGKVGL